MNRLLLVVALLLTGCDQLEPTPPRCSAVDSLVFVDTTQAVFESDTFAITIQSCISGGAIKPPVDIYNRGTR